jgi:hypothetical protein
VCRSAERERERERERECVCVRIAENGVSSIIKMVVGRMDHFGIS